MVRGRGKAKRFSMTNHEDNRSGEEEKIPVQKKRGRPQKPFKGEENYDITKEGESSENTDNGVVSEKEIKKVVVAENGNKRRRSLQGKEKPEKVETSFGKSSIKSNGFRQNGSRRKSTPRRAAEVGVECNQ